MGMMKILFAILLSTTALSGFAESDISELLDKLDHSLDHKVEYETVKKDRIAKLHSVLQSATDLEVRYETELQLFEEYKSYRYDSASVCAKRGLDIATQLGNDIYMAQAKCNIAFSLVLAGIPMEANRILSSIPSSSLPVDIRRQYFFACYKLWQEESNRIQRTALSQEYLDKSKGYLDSLLMLVPEKDAEYWNLVGSKMMRVHKPQEAIRAFEKYLSNKNLDAHRKAMAYAEMAWAYSWTGDEDKAIENFAYSAIYDNESATREITALYLLAKRIADRGESDRAIKYVHMALDDVSFYDARQRLIELGEILPSIEQERYNIIKKQRQTLALASTLALLFVVAVLFNLYTTRKKNRLLTIAEEQERKSLEALEVANEQLKESNTIKTQYIGMSFYSNAEFIAKLDKLCKAVDRQLKTKQYDKIKDTIAEEKLKQERDNMFVAFDEAFLTLYPRFVEEYNNLFAEEDRRYPTKENSLTSEMRIFALIRLGITDSDRIGNFLNYSVHTVNTYKTRVKNRAIVENDKFEQSILAI